MKIEIVTIGDEIVSGHTVDTNAAFLARLLGDAGFAVTLMSSVGDDSAMIEKTIRTALGRVDVTIATGGLGPTCDDLTKRVIVKVFKRKLVFHDEILAELERRYALRGMTLPPASQGQALLPQGATLFPNPIGSAVGICIEEHEKVFIALPGVPREMEVMATDEVIPYLLKRKHTSVTHVVKIRTTGIGETIIAQQLAAKASIEPTVKLAYLPSYGGVDLRISATGVRKSDAKRKAEQAAACIEAIIKEFVFARENVPLEQVVGTLLQKRGKTLSVAESCTGGQLGMMLTSIPGSSDYFVGGAICYANDVKISQLKVDKNILKTDGAVSARCAIAMATGARKLYKTNYALAITGIAGPDGGTADKPVGTTWIGCAVDRRALAQKFHFGSDRQVIRTRASYAALEILRRELLGIKK